MEMSAKMSNLFLSLPEDDDVLILRADAPQYGFPAAATFAKWASLPSDAPVELPYVQVGRRVAYRVGTLRKLREALTFRHSAERTAARAYKAGAAAAST